MAAASDALELRAGPLTLGLVPAIGGSASFFRRDSIDIMRPLAGEFAATGNVLGTAMFPMVPYANRIDGNSFTFRGQTYRVEANVPGEPYNVHGTGWQRPWQVSRATESEAVLELAHEAPSEPYSYRATQRFVLSADALTVTMTLENRGATAMPFGFGVHPWFERDDDVSLQFSARRFYLEEPQGVSGDPITLPPELDFSDDRPLPGGWRNNNYGGWAGTATLRFPSRGLGLTMRADPVFKHLMVYADPTKTFFCVEPQTNASSTFNRPEGFTDPDEGVIVLEPDETASGTVRFEVFAL